MRLDRSAGSPPALWVPGQLELDLGDTGAEATGRSVRFLHTADWQLGMTRHFLDADAQPRYTAARIDAIERIGAVAAAQRCEFVLVCGDVFESNTVSPQVVSRSLEAMRSIGVPVYLLPGNHDPLDASSIYTSKVFTAAVPSHVHVLSKPGAHLVREGVEIVAAPWFSKHPRADLVGQAIEGLPADGTVRIVAGHGATDRLNPDAASLAVIRLDPVERAIADQRIHYLALGDRHSATSVDQGGRVWYSGTQEVTDFDEKDPGQALVVDIDPDSGIDVERHRVGSWHFRDLEFPVNDLVDLAAFDDDLANLSAKDRSVLRLRLTGTLTLANRMRLDELLERHRRLFAAVNIWEKFSDIAVLVEDGELTDLGVSGFAESAVAELVTTAAASGSDATTARDALSLLYRLAGGRR